MKPLPSLPRLAWIAGSLLLGLTLPSAQAETDAHHQHPAATASLQLDHGKKWATDAPLRQGMANLQQAFDAVHVQIHRDRFQDNDYASLATQVQTEVDRIITQCHLSPEADAQLHPILAELIRGAEAMSGKSTQTRRRDGALIAMSALKNFQTYFDTGTP